MALVSSMSGLDGPSPQFSRFDGANIMLVKVTLKHCIVLQWCKKPCANEQNWFTYNQKPIFLKVLINSMQLTATVKKPKPHKDCLCEKENKQTNLTPKSRMKKRKFLQRSLLRSRSSKAIYIKSIGSDITEGTILACVESSLHYLRSLSTTSKPLWPNVCLPSLHWQKLMYTFLCTQEGRQVP